MVWVGFDDAKDLNLEGAKSALPIWTEFMKRAHQHREYRNVQDWDAPDGIVSVDIDPPSGQLATGACPTARAEYFVSGTQPVEMCRLHGGSGTQVAGWETTPATAAAAPIPAQSQVPVSDQGRQYGAAGTSRRLRWPKRSKPRLSRRLSRSRKKRGVSLARSRIYLSEVTGPPVCNRGPAI